MIYENVDRNVEDDKRRQALLRRYKNRPATIAELKQKEKKQRDEELEDTIRTRKGY